jgi:hypothetical protein
MPLTHAVTIVRACMSGKVGAMLLLHAAVLIVMFAFAYAMAVRWVGRRLIA